MSLPRLDPDLREGQTVQQHTLSILLQNESGALARVAGLFAARHVNIDALTVAATHDLAVSRLTLVLHGNAATLKQIVTQTRKLIDVLDVQTLPGVGSDGRPAGTPTT